MCRQTVIAKKCINKIKFEGKNKRTVKEKEIEQTDIQRKRGEICLQCSQFFTA